jgi:raffinose/stachyose/melibiose transport system permease protein
MTLPGNRREQLVSYVVLSALALITLFPLIGIVVAAFHAPGDQITGFPAPTSFTFDAFRSAWREGHFSQYLQSSAIVSVTVVVVTTVLSILAGYAFGAMDFPGRDVLFYVFLLGIIMPSEVLIVPIYYALRERGLLDTYFAVIGPEIGLFLAFGTFWMRSFFLETPRELTESARLDGANSWTILWKVLLPLARPAVTTLMTLLFLFSWNEFLLPLVVTADPDKFTAPLGLAFFQGEHLGNPVLQSAGAVIVAAPVVVVYVLLQRHFVRGLLSGAVKG